MTHVVFVSQKVKNRTRACSGCSKQADWKPLHQVISPTKTHMHDTHMNTQLTLSHLEKVLLINARLKELC